MYSFCLFVCFFSAFSPSYEVVIFIALLGVSASASLPFPSGLVLVLINENNIKSETKFTHMLLAELRSIRI